MNWTELKDNVYYCDGSLRDIYVLDVSRHDWEKWVDHVNKNYRIEWFNGKTGTDESQIDFNSVKEVWTGNSDFHTTAKVFVDKIQVNAHFFIDTEIENDIAPAEITSIKEHEKLLKYMTDISTLLNKEVILTPQNMSEIVLVKVMKDDVAYP